MCFSLIGTNTLTAFAANDASTFLDVTSTGMQNSKISFIINLRPNVTKFSGAIINVKFDSSVLEIEEAAPVYTVDEDGNPKLNVYGEYVNGFVSGSDNVYSVAYMNNNGVTTGNSEYRGLFKITFKVKGSERPSTSVSFTCKEIFTNDDVNNDIRPSDSEHLKKIKEIIFSTLDNPMPLSAEILANGISFRWSAVEGAEEYTVLRKADNEGVWRDIAVVTSDVTEYIDNNVESGVTYTYSVKCANGEGYSGYFASGSTQLFLESAKITTITSLTNSVRIMWGGVAGAENYAVYRQDPFTTEWKLLGKTASAKLYYVDETVESNKTYKYAIATEKGDVSSIIGVGATSHRFLASPEVYEAENTANGIKLTWYLVDGAQSYEIYRKTNADASWELLTTTTKTGFEDGAVINGKTYYYAVKSVVGDFTSSFSTSVSVSRITSPKLTYLESSADGVTVNWEKVENATSYTIYRKTPGEKEWQKIATTGLVAESYKDITVDGGYYSYAVTANIGESESPMATIDYDAYFLRSPKDISVKNTMNGLVVSWEASKNAEYYIVKRITGDESTGTVIAEVKTTSLTDESVENSEKYAYSVIAVDANGISSIGNPYTLSFYRVLPPEVTSVTASTDSIIVNWEAVEGVDSYNVYRLENKSWVKIATLASGETTYEDPTVLSGVQYTYTVTAVKNNSESYLGEDNAKSATYVNKPTNLNASITAAGVTLSWEITDDLSDFIIYKRVKGETEWKLFKNVSSDTKTVLDSDVISGVTYEYAIKSVSADGTFESSLSDTEEVTFLSKVQTIKLANTISGVKINWSKVSGAENYLVYRRLSNGTWENIATVSSKTLSYVDKTAESGKTYYYTIRALANGYRSAYQNYQIFYLAAPQVFELDSEFGKGITVKWADVRGADRYYVYRKTGNSSWQRIATTENLLYVDKNVKFGTTYTYTVRANGGGINSPYNTSGWKRQFTTGTPKVTSVKNSTTSITVKWNSVTGASGYIVYRKAMGETKWSQLAKVKSTSFVDKNVKKNVKYTYTIRAYRGSVLSAYNKTGWSAAILTAPTVKIANASAGVKVSWTKNNAATGYTVYRATYDPVNRKWSSWKTMGTAKANVTSWVDKSAQSGTTYRYTVRTLCSSSKSSYKASASVLYMKEPKVTVTTSSNGVTVKWTQALQAKGYRVYRSEYNESTGKWSSWKTMGTAKYSVNSWTDRSVVSGVTYRYTVRSVNGKALSSYTPSNSIKYLSTPVLSGAIKTDDGNVITYQEVEGAEGYRIYRKTADIPWVAIADVKGGSNIIYTDSQIEGDVEYVYTVRAISGSYLSYYDTKGVTCK